MGQLELFGPHDEVAVEQQVEVERARRVGERPRAAVPRLDRLQLMQQGERRQCRSNSRTAFR